MSGGLNRLLASAFLAGVVLALPPAALADCGSTASAVNVYSECLSSGGGGKHTSGSPSSSSTPAPVSQQTAKALQKAGSDGQSLSNLVKTYGTRRLLQSSSSAPASQPTAVSSAFDLGSGPTALLIVLAGTAVLLLGGSGMRAWRNRQHP